MTRRQSGNPLGGGDPARALPWIVGLMVFLATLATAGGMALNTLAGKWNSGLAETVTIRLPAAVEQENADARLRKVVEIVRRSLGDDRFHVLSMEETAALLEPWLGRELDLSALPLPRLIRLDVGANADPGMMQTLRSRLETAAPDAVLDDHRLWRSRAAKIFLSLRLAAWTAVLVVAACAVLTVMLTTRSGMAVHRNIIEILCLLGARDNYIAGRFQARALVAAAKGGIPAGLMGMAVVLLLSRIAGGGEFPGAVDWLTLALVPAAAMLVTAATARWTVIRALQETA